MIRTSIRLSACAAAALALVIAPGVQAQSGGFSLPPPSPTPTPAPQGPVDERAGVVIPPRSLRNAQGQATVAPAPTTTLAPQPTPLAIPAPTRSPRPASGAAARPGPAPAPSLNPAPLPDPTGAAPSASANPAARVQSLPDSPAAAPSQAAPGAALPEAIRSAEPLALPDWWPWAAGGLGGLVVLASGLMLWRRRKPRVRRLAPPTQPSIDSDAQVPALPRLDLALEVTGATRSVMMFTLAYRLTLINRTDRAVSDVQVAVQIACARRGVSNAAAPGAAHRLAQIARIGPHQSRSITGEAQLPLAAIAPLRQGKAALFIPLVHVTLEGEGQQALTRSFVIGAPSTASTGRVHPIVLEGPPGGIRGLVAQSVAIPPDSAAA